MNYDHPGLLEKLAGEYVLGTMSARVRRRFAQILLESLPAQRAVAEWTTRLEPLSRAIPLVSPSRQVWRAIERRTRPASAATSRSDNIRARWSDWMKPALGFCFGIVVTFGLIQQAPQMFGLESHSNTLAASYVGLLTDATGAPAVAASSLRRGTVLSIKILKPLAIPGGKVAQLWALPVDGAPIPVGVIPASGKVDIRLGAPAEKIFAKVPKLAVSFEATPAAKAPSGEFVLSGHCIKIW